MTTDTLANEVSIDPSPRRTVDGVDRIDWLIAVGLGVVALLYRRRVPSDGFFFDDAWQALAAVKGSFSQLMTVGQTQPGFGLELMTWSRIFGSSTASMVTPALIMGTLGPPSLFVVLRRLRFARPIAALLGAALTVSATHIIYSTRVKSYTTEVVVVLALVLVVPWFARRTWTRANAVAWVIGSFIVGSISSFTLLAAAAAGVIVVLHPMQDRRRRLLAVASEGALLLALSAAVERTHSVSLLAGYFLRTGGYVDLTLNPISFVSDVVAHVMRIVQVFPGGPWYTTLAMTLAAAFGILSAAVGGPRSVAARFLLLMVVIAFFGSLVHRIPFGPNNDAFRATMWTAPLVALGLAVTLERVRTAIRSRGRTSRLVFDALLFVVAALLLLTPIGVRRPYPSAGGAATADVMSHLRSDDVLLIARPTIFSFAYYANTPVRIQPNADLVQGFLPRFKDRRLVPVDFLTSAQRSKVDAAVRTATRVFVLDSNNVRDGLRTYREALDQQISQNGFVRVNTRKVRGTSITIWARPPAG